MCVCVLCVCVCVCVCKCMSYPWYTVVPVESVVKLMPDMYILLVIYSSKGERLIPPPLLFFVLMSHEQGSDVT